MKQGHVSPPIRAGLLLHPLATISLFICLSLILKFAHEGGRVGLMTGGALTLFLTVTIISGSHPPPAFVPPAPPPQAVAPKPVPPTPTGAEQSKPISPPAPEQPKPAQPIQPQQPAKQQKPQELPKPIEPPPAPSEEKTLIASDGAQIKLVSGVIYHLKLRAGQTTVLQSNDGKFKIVDPQNTSGACIDHLEFKTPESKLPFSLSDAILISCGEDGTQINVQTRN